MPTLMNIRVWTLTASFLNIHILDGQTVYEPAHEILVVIALSSTEGPGVCARAFANRIHKVWM